MKEALEKLKRLSIGALIIFLVLAIFILPAISIAVVFKTEFASPETAGLVPITSNIKFGLMHPFKTIGILRSTPAGLTSYFNGIKIVLLLVIAFVIFLMFRRGEETDPWENKEHASSRWCKKGEQYSILSKTDGILLAKDNYLPIDKPGNINVMVVGGSGTGKSSAFVIPNVLSLLGSYVFTDPKGELYDDTAGYFKANGYEIKVLNLINPSKSDGFNPLMNIRNDDIDIDIVTNTIIHGQDSPTGGDPYWDNMAEKMLKALILFLMEARPVEERNLASCANLVRLASNTGSFNVVENLMKVLPEDSKARKAYQDVQIATDKAYSSILSTLQSKLGKFDAPSIAALTSTNTIDFVDITKKKTALYVISPDSHSTYDFLLTIFFSQMIQRLYDYADTNSGRVDIPVFFFLDEFANIGQIPDFDKKISTSRSRNINFSVIVQNIDQLEAIYPESFETILSNCDTHLYLGSNSQKTSEYFSKELGEVNIVQKTVSVSKTKDKGGDEKGGTSESSSLNKFSRPLMTPDELRRLDADKCIILEKGLYPILAEKAFHFKDPKSKILLKYKEDHNAYTVNRGSWSEFDPNKRARDLKNTKLEKTLEKLDDKEKDILGIQNEKKQEKDENNVQALGIEDLYNEAKDNRKSINNKKENKIKPIVFEDEILDKDYNEKNEKNTKIVNESNQNREVKTKIIENENTLNTTDKRNNEFSKTEISNTISDVDIDFENDESEKTKEEKIENKKENHKIDPKKNLDFNVAREIEKKFDEIFGFFGE